MADLSWTIDPDGTGDYTSLASWESNEQQDLTDGGGDTATANCISSNGSADNTAASISGWITNSSCWVRVRSTGANRHQGQWDANKYRLEVANATALLIADDYVKIDGLQIRVSSASAAGQGCININSIAATNNLIEIYGCILRSHNNGTYWVWCISIGDADTNIRCWNNLIYDLNTTISDVIGIRLNCTTGYAYNNTIIGGYSALRSVAGTNIIKNNLSQSINSSGTAYSGNPTAWHSDSRNNLREDNAQATANICFGAQQKTGTTTNKVLNKLVDSGGGLSSILIGSVIHNLDRTMYTHVTAIDSDTQLSVANDIFNNNNDYVIYYNIQDTVTFDSGNYHLDEADTGAKDKGIDCSSDSYLPFDDDIDLDTHSGIWDIGADEYVILDVTVEPSPVNTIAGRAGPSVILGSITLSPSAINAIARKNDPTVILGSIIITPSSIFAITGKVDPITVLGSLTLSPLAINAITKSIDPSLIISGDIVITPGAINAITSKVDPDVILGNITLSPSAINSIAGTIDPDIILGSISIIPTAINVIGTVEGPTVVIEADIYITPIAISAIGKRINPGVILGSISLTPGSSAAITSKADPSVILGSISLTPSAINAIVSKVDPSIILGSITLSPDALNAVVKSIDPNVVTSEVYKEILELNSYIQKTLDLESAIVDGIDADINIILDFDGNDYYRGPAFDISSDFVIEFDFYIPTIQDSDFLCIFSNAHAAQSYMSLLFIGIETILVGEDTWVNKFLYMVSDDTGSYQYAEETDPDSVPQNEWIHIKIQKTGNILSCSITLENQSVINFVDQDISGYTFTFDNSGLCCLISKYYTGGIPDIYDCMPGKIFKDLKGDPYIFGYAFKDFFMTQLADINDNVGAVSNHGNAGDKWFQFQELNQAQLYEGSKNSVPKGLTLIESNIIKELQLKSGIEDE